MRSFALALALLPATATSSFAADTWDDKIKEYLHNNYLVTIVSKTPDAVVAYLCRPQGGASWWAYKLSDTSLKNGHILLRGATAYNSYDAGGQQHGQGVFFGSDRGPLFEGPPRPGDRAAPMPAMPAITIQARGSGGPATFELGTVTRAVAAEIRNKCPTTYPRAFHPQVLIGRNAR